MRSVSFSTRDRDTVMESCFSRHQTNLQQHNFTWELSEFGRAQTGFRLLCWRICGDSETLLQWQIWKPNQTYKALKLRQCILPFVDSIYILKVDVSIVKAHRLKPTGLLAEAVNVEMHVWSRVEQTLFPFIRQKRFNCFNPKSQPISLHDILFQTFWVLFYQNKNKHIICPAVLLLL